MASLNTPISKKSERDEASVYRKYNQVIRSIKDEHSETLKDARDRYSNVEREGWSELVEDAKNGGGTCIEKYAEKLNISVEDAVDRILTRREQYRTAYGNATGQLTDLRDKADNILSDYESNSIDHSEALEKLNNIQWVE